MRRSLDHSKTRSGERGFTLVELLVVIAIVGTLTALLLPAVQAAREAARRIACGNHMKQMALGLLAYHDAYGTFPPGCTGQRPSAGFPNGKRIAWSTLILPFIEQQHVYDMLDLSVSFDSVVNDAGNRQAIRVYLCPSTCRYLEGRDGDTTGDRNGNGQADRGDYWGCIDYGGCYGYKIPGQMSTNNGVMIYEAAMSLKEVEDGASCTIAVCEDSGRGWVHYGLWADGQNIFDQHGRINARQDNEMWSEHPRGVNAAFCDGSAHFLSQEISEEALRALCTRARGDHVETDSFQ
ncbi:MAG TPA: DUF1559 domain-containing protein [Thermoguttaceae bacterium]|nr:DUF1559 domain-containing protein [Thermoguttaceae bacterium]